MKLFTPGPVNMKKVILKAGSKQPPYFRTTEFSDLNLENERMLLSLIKSHGRIVVLTSAGTGGMDAVVTNFVDTSKVLVVNGGTFGKRWSELCKFYNCDYVEIKVPFGRNIDLEQFENMIIQHGAKIVLAQGTETSSGQRFPLKEMGEITYEHGVLFIVDAITSFLADPYEMDPWHIDVSVLSSQKGLCLPPGISIVVIGPKADEHLLALKSKSFYFDLKRELSDMLRGQTSFSPAVSAIYQLNLQLKHFIKRGFK